jgi:hypothetical protein
MTAPSPAGPLRTVLRSHGLRRLKGVALPCVQALRAGGGGVLSQSQEDRDKTTLLTGSDPGFPSASPLNSPPRLFSVSLLDLDLSMDDEDAQSSVFLLPSTSLTAFCRPRFIELHRRPHRRRQKKGENVRNQ